MNTKDIYDIGQRIRQNVLKVIVGKADVVDLLLVALFGGGSVA